jgi:hypothetical protein
MNSWTLIRTYESTKRRSGSRLQPKRSCSGAGDVALINWDDGVGADNQWLAEAKAVLVGDEWRVRRAGVTICINRQNGQFEGLDPA